jgi:hypothetical protein
MKSNANNVKTHKLSDKHTVEYKPKSNVESPNKTKNEQINVPLYGEIDREFACEQKGNIGDFLDRRGILVLINFSF